MVVPVDVFVSYSHEDKRRVRDLVRRLQRAGLNVWFDERLRPSETWPRRLREEIRQRRVFLFLITSHTLSSHWCRWELYQAARANRLVIPVRFDEIEMPPELQDVQYVDCSDRRDCAKKVLNAIREALAVEETIYRLRPPQSKSTIGVRGRTLLHQLPQNAVHPPRGPRYPSRWRHELEKRWKLVWAVLVLIVFAALGGGAMYWLLRGGTSIEATSGTLTGEERVAAGTSISPTSDALTPSPRAATPTARVCALGPENVWVYEQPLVEAHAFMPVAPQQCMETWWRLTDTPDRVWFYVPEAERDSLNRGGWVRFDAETVRLEGRVPSVFDAVLCEGQVSAYGAGLSTTTNVTPRYVTLRNGEGLLIFARSGQPDEEWYYAAAQRNGNWLFGWIPAEQVAPLGQCPPPQ